MKREIKKGETLVSESNKVVSTSHDGAKIAFFEKEIKTNDGKKTFVREYIYINYGSDKHTILIKPVGQKRLTDSTTGDLLVIPEQEFYKKAYDAFLLKKGTLNKIKK
jgi:hypothetical protein